MSFNISRLTYKYQLMLVIVVLFVVYYPSIHAEVSLLDDSEMISSLFNADSANLHGLFFPKVKEGGYYRPIIGLTYYIDKSLWLLDAKIMHLENVLIHILNACLVFLIGKYLFKSEFTLFPLASALLFGLHPVNTESVNWISGRTDLLAGSFILLSALALMLYLSKKSWWILGIALLSICFGVLTKESAIGFFIGGVLILGVDKRKKIEHVIPLSRQLFLLLFFCVGAILCALITYNFYLVIIVSILFMGTLIYWQFSLSNDRGWVLNRIFVLGLVVGAITFSAVFFSFIRASVFASSTSKIATTLKLMAVDPGYTIQLFLGTAGFYIKKFFYPFPLNIAIREVDPLFELFGIVCLFMCIIMLVRRTMASSLFLAGCMMFVPALPIAFGTIAWTAYADRYIYLSTPFWILAVACTLQGISDRQQYLRLAVRSCTMFLLIGAMVATVSRNLQWQSNKTIFEDAVSKTPDFRAVRGLYMLALAKQGQYKEAFQQYSAAMNIHAVKYEEQFDLNMAQILFRQGKDKEGLAYIQKAIDGTRGKSVVPYQHLAAYYEGVLMWQKTNQDQAKETRKKLIGAYQKNLELDKDPFVMYKCGQNYLALSNKELAKRYFLMAYNTFPDNDQYKEFSRRILKKMGGVP